MRTKNKKEESRMEEVPESTCREKPGLKHAEPSGAAGQKASASSKGLMNARAFLISVFLALALALSAHCVCAADTSAPQVEDTYPSGTINYTGVTIGAITDENATCRYDTQDENYSSMTGIFSSTGATEHEEDLGTLTEGSHTYYMRCNDTNNNTMDSSEEISFTIDSEGPSVTNHTPTGTVSASSVVFKVSTTEEADCRYDPSPSKDYSNMSGSFDRNGTTQHSTVLEGLTDGSYEYYVKCRDSESNTGSEYEAEFRVEIDTTAKIILGDESPVKEGLIDVTLITTKNMEPTPSLSYTLSDAPPSSKTVTRSVPLTGSGSIWEGYMAIAKDDNDRIGEFQLKGTDINGDKVTVITSGNVFVVDTDKPPSVSSIAASAEPDGCINLEWYYDGEEEDHYRIYRSTSAGVEQIHKIDETENMLYEDCAVVEGTKYYYRVSVVDKAGNEGDLSIEVSEKAQENRSEKEKTESAEEREGLSEELMGLVETHINKVDALIGQLDEAKSKAGSYNSPLKEIARTIRLEKGIDEGISALKSVKKDIEGLKDRDMGKADLKRELSRADNKISSIKEGTPSEIEVAEERHKKLEMPVKTLRKELEGITEEMSAGKGLPEENAEESIRMSRDLEGKTSIDSSVRRISVTHLDGTSRIWTFIKKEVAIEPKHRDLFNDTLIVEKIPKEQAQSAGEINSEKSPKVIKDDPIIAWGLNFDDDSQKTFTYYIKKDAGLESPDSIIMKDPESITPKEGMLDRVTGYITYENMKKPSFFTFVLIVVIMGLMIYYFLSTEKEETGSEEGVTGGQHDEEAGNTEEEESRTGSRKFFSGLGSRIAVSMNAMANAGRSAADGAGARSRGNIVSISGGKEREDYADMLGTEAWEEYSSAGIQSLKDISLREIAEKANERIDALDFTTASRMYFMMISRYNMLQEAGKLDSLPDIEEVHYMMNLVYDKLCLHMRVKEAENRLRNGDYINLKHSLNGIAGIYNKMARIYREKDSKLMARARECHNRNAAMIIDRKETFRREDFRREDTGRSQGWR
ncbi:MAG: hypothetical protein R6U32_04505 [Candidatus Woesearchaeota archaeon]